VQAVASGVLDPSTVVGLAEVVRGTAVDLDRPVLFKSVGMAWEDLVIAASDWEGRA
jgi:ornithine cyclodeaminase